MRTKVCSGLSRAPATRGPAVAARGVKVKRTKNSVGLIPELLRLRPIQIFWISEPDTESN